LCAHEPLSYVGVNIVGLRRRGFSSEAIRTIKDIYDTIYYQGYNTSDGCTKVEAGFPQSEERDIILKFIRESKRGIIPAMKIREKVEIE
jgi:UDP-N-acetylglucosamine acyltransferase